MKKFLKMIIDIDDTLMHFNDIAIALANEDENPAIPYYIDEITQWEPRGDRSDIVLKYYHDPRLYERQTPFDGAKEFIRKLSKRCELFISTAVYKPFMQDRIDKIIKYFPEINPQNILIGSRKDLIHADFMLDDGPHNIVDSSATYPILLRRPWNQSITGCLSANTYDEVLAIIDTIMDSGMKEEEYEGNRAIILVGPSASGKTELMNSITSKKLATRIKSTTTRPKRSETENDYYFISKSDFRRKEVAGEFLETTRYAGNCYGTTKKEIEGRLENGNVITAMDICGAVAVKRAFPKETVLVFVNRPKKAIISAILERNITNEDKTNRIISLSDEYKNINLCDYVINNDSDIETAVKQLENILYGMKNYEKEEL